VRVGSFIRHKCVGCQNAFRLGEESDVMASGTHTSCVKIRIRCEDSHPPDAPNTHPAAAPQSPNQPINQSHLRGARIRVTIIRLCHILLC